jgi:Beta-1,3-glucanase
LPRWTAPYQIPAPSRDSAFQAGGQYQNYFNSYTTSLGYSVATSDVFGCAGSLASNAALCAALNRHVAQLPQAQWNNAGNYYQSSPANYYAQFWHNNDIDGHAYGFPYDDVNNQSSYVSVNNPQYMLIAVGW